MNCATADDTVLLKPTGASRTPTRITGTITEYTGRELFIRTVGGREQLISADRVDEILTTHTQDHIDADTQYAADRFAQAEALYRKAIREESRQWVRRRIMAQVVWCLRHQQKHESAAATFLLIVENDSTTQFFDAIPLAWRPVAVGLAAERKAIEWMRDDRDPVAQLIGASWLLSGPVERRTEAERVIEDLTRARELRVAQLAETQLWRTRLATVNANDIVRWQAAIDRLPDSLRCGPYYMLGQALARQRKYDQAALALMRVPILFPNERELSAEALLAAADSLEKAERLGEAHNCLRELLREYPTSNAAAAAKSKLEQGKTGG